LSKQALQEDVDVVGLVFLSGAHMALVPASWSCSANVTWPIVRVFVGRHHSR